MTTRTATIAITTSVVVTEGSLTRRGAESHPRPEERRSAASKVGTRPGTSNQAPPGPMRLSLLMARPLWPALLALLLAAGAARAAGSADTAALQVELRQRSLYAGEVDGLYGP